MDGKDRWKCPAVWVHLHRDSENEGRKYYAVETEACDARNTVERDAPGIIKTPCDHGQDSDWCKGWILFRKSV